jgi:signal transduction histidine kinase
MAELHLGFTGWAAPYFVASAIVWSMAGLVFLRGRGALRLPFVALLVTVGFTLASTGLVFSATDVRSATWLTRLSQGLSTWTAPSAVAFASASTGRPLVRLRRASLALAALGCALSLATPWVITSARAYAYGFAGRPGPLYPLALAATSGSLAAPWVIVGHLRRRERGPLDWRQLELVAAASVIGGLAFVDTLPVMGVPMPPLGWLPLTVSTAALLLAIVRYRLLDIRVAMRRTLLWLGFTLVGALPFVAVAVALVPRLGEHPLEQGVFFAALVVGMRTYVVALQPRLERLVGRRQLDLDAELARLANQAGTLQTTEELGRAIDGFLAAVDRRLAALVVIDPSGRPRVALSAWGAVPAPSRGSPLLHELHGARSLISRDHARGPARLELERACVRWGAEYLAPLVEGDRLHGLIAISPKLGGGLADTVELEALDRICVTVTAALAGARLYEQLRTLSRELEQKAEARKQSLARALEDLSGAEARLVESEKLASLGQIVAGVAADLSEQVEIAFAEVARLRDQAELLVVAAEETRASRPELADARFDEASRDVGPLLDAVTEGARRAHVIAEELATFAPAQGPAHAGRRAARLDALIDSTLTLASAQLDGVNVVRDYDASLPAVDVEPEPLGQVILNLILNAAQAMRGAGTLTLSTRRRPGVAELAVADTGPGIAPEVLPRIFEPFFTTKGPQAGTGLGLSISYGIVARQGGRLAVESAPGRGSVFRVELPLPAGD